MASVTASTKRSPAPDANGIVTAPVAHLASVAIFPLAPMDDQVRQLLGMTAIAGEIWQTFTRETDIKEGDVLTVASVEYPVRAVGDWPWRPTGADRVVVAIEEIKTA